MDYTKYQVLLFIYLFILHDDYQEAKTKSLGKVPTSYPDIASLIFILLKRLLSNIYKTVQFSQVLLQNIYFNVRSACHMVRILYVAIK